MRPASARETLHPALRSLVSEYAYLAGIALVALAVGVGALALAQRHPDDASVDVNRMKAVLQEDDYPVESVGA